MNLAKLERSLSAIYEYQNLCTEPGIELVDLVKLKALLERHVHDVNNIRMGVDGLIHFRSEETTVPLEVIEDCEEVEQAKRLGSFEGGPSFAEMGDRMLIKHLAETRPIGMPLPVVPPMELEPPFPKHSIK